MDAIAECLVDDATKRRKETPVTFKVPIASASSSLLSLSDFLDDTTPHRPFLRSNIPP